MSSLARKLQEQQHEQRQQIAQPERRRAARQKVTPGERVIWMLFAAFLCLGAVQIISTQAEIYKTNKDIQKMKVSVSEMQKENGDLTVLKEELSSYERIMAKAEELGLKFDDKKVKVVH
ncbi:cell division protein FtsL [Bacillus sp. FJAT-27225]|uniref:cell division protein FtsL n=1 Tax=Bacillus sp. FJAT-27225 TaxID=1743144 RepID=UPI00080C3311|nr:cell division protein FtsL [Bacillus sp. FJAT-27225]OCA85541.1 cell division protein FtsL [Bacillus sp. FJAT-27225]